MNLSFEHKNLIKYAFLVNEHLNDEIYTNEDLITIKNLPKEEAERAYYRIVWSAHYGNPYYVEIDGSIFCNIFNCLNCCYSRKENFCEERVLVGITNKMILEIINKIEQENKDRQDILYNINTNCCIK